MNKSSQTRHLSDHAAAGRPLDLGPEGEEAWIEVIRKMDEVYADLVRYQVELEQKNSALEEAQKFIDSVRAAMTDVLLVCDRHGRIQQVNPALERLTGQSEQALRNQPITALFHPSSVPLTERFVHFLQQDWLVDFEVALTDAEGGASLLALNGSKRCDHRGRLLGTVLVGRPLGELRRAYAQLQRAHEDLKATQQQLVHAEKMASLGRLVAGVAHELNNPISFVYGNMHALKRYARRITEYLDACERESSAEVLQSLRKDLKIDRVLADIGPLIDGTLEGAERVSEIVQDLRRYSSSQKEPRTVCDLSQLIQTATHWVTKAAARKPEVIYRLPQRLDAAICKGQVHQILVNLVQNAVDVMDGAECCVLEIGCERQADDIVIEVRDHGPGIPAEHLAQVFDPFFTTKPVGKGTGLGLYISYGLAREQGGDLRVRNHPEGGAVFSLILPTGDGADGR